MHVRIAQFEADPGSIDQMVSGVRESLDRGRQSGSAGGAGAEMEGLEGVRRVMLLVDRDRGQVTNLVFCDNAEELRSADEALNKMSPDGDVRRTSVGMYELAIDEQMR
jgi:hypothetical protein